MSRESGIFSNLIALYLTRTGRIYFYTREGEEFKIGEVECMHSKFVIDMEVSTNHALFLTKSENGKQVFSTGSNHYGQLGCFFLGEEGTKSNSSSLISSVYHVHELDYLDVIRVSVTNTCSFVLAKDKKLWRFGE